MTQIARPICPDISDGLWTQTPICSRINGVTAGPGVVSSSPNPQGDAFVVQLAPLAWPSPGMETLTVSLAKTGTDDVPVTIALLQGNTIIAAQQVSPGLSFANYTLTLTAAQVATISDYTNLRVRISAGLVTVACCANALPPTLYANFSGDIICTCLPASMPLHYNPASGKWEGTLDTVGTCGGGPMTLRFYCAGNTCLGWRLDMIWCFTTLAVPAYSSGCTCNPLAVSFGSFGGTTCGNCGGAAFVVTVTI